MSAPIGDPRKAGEEGPAGDQRKAGEEGIAGDPRPAGEAKSNGTHETSTTDDKPKAAAKKASGKGKGRA